MSGSSSPPPSIAMSGTQQVVEEARSTLLNHAFPPMYVCYLLQSKATPGSKRTYVGSTPDPPRRLRQHNGELVQGAVRTKRHRPWEMQMIVYGFPSKLTALQFEWAWQKPELSRHLRRAHPNPTTSVGEDGGVITTLSEGLAPPLFPRTRMHNHPARKMEVARALLARMPFRRLPLKVRVFTPSAWDIWTAFDTGSALPNPDDGLPAIPRTTKAAAAKPRKRAVNTMAVLHSTALPASIQVTLDLGGVDGKTHENRRRSTKGVTSWDGAIDVEDEEFRDAAWEKWKRAYPHEGTAQGICGKCRGAIDLDNHLSYSFCHSTSACGTIHHLSCLAPHFLSSTSKVPNDPSPPRALLPKDGSCPTCRTPQTWGEVIRSCYARRDGVIWDGKEEVKAREKEAKLLIKQQERDAKAAAKPVKVGRKPRGKAMEVMDDVEEDIESESGSEVSVASSPGRRRRGRNILESGEEDHSVSEEPSSGSDAESVNSIPPIPVRTPTPRKRTARTSTTVGLRSSPRPGPSTVAAQKRLAKAAVKASPVRKTKSATILGSYTQAKPGLELSPSGSKAQVRQKASATIQAKSVKKEVWIDLEDSGSDGGMAIGSGIASGTSKLPVKGRRKAAIVKLKTGPQRRLLHSSGSEGEMLDREMMTLDSD